MVSQRLKNFREVVDTGRVLERNKELEQKNIVAQARAKEKIEDKGNGRKPFQAVEQGKAQVGDATREKTRQRNNRGQKFDKDAYFQCNEKGHQKKNFPQVGQ